MDSKKITIKHRVVLSLTMLMMALPLFCGCQKELPRISVNPNDVTFEYAASAKDVYVDATDEWTAQVQPSSAASWVSLSSEEGDGSQYVSVSVTTNYDAGADASTYVQRHATVVFTLTDQGGKNEVATLHVTQNYRPEN